MSRPISAADRRRRAERRGRLAEGAAAALLQLKGYRVLARRAKTPAGELDLVVRRGRIIAFVEVKYRASADAALQAVPPPARQRLTRAAAVWMAQSGAPADWTLRFDVIAMAPWRWPRHVRGAWMSDDLV